MRFLYADWKKDCYTVSVHIPTLDGKGVSETREVTVEAYRNPADGEIYLDGAALDKLDEVKSRHMGLLPPVSRILYINQQKTHPSHSSNMKNRSIKTKGNARLIQVPLDRISRSEAFWQKALRRITAAGLIKKFPTHPVQLEVFIRAA